MTITITITILILDCVDFDEHGNSFILDFSRVYNKYNKHFNTLRNTFFNIDRPTHEYLSLNHRRETEYGLNGLFIRI